MGSSARGGGAIRAREAPPVPRGWDRLLGEERRSDREENEEQEGHLDECERIECQHPDRKRRDARRDCSEQPASFGRVSSRLPAEPSDRSNEEPEPAAEARETRGEQRTEPLVVENVRVDSCCVQVDDLRSISLA